jgi:hypothetical protein
MLVVACAMMLGGWLVSAGTTLYEIKSSATDSSPDRDWARDPVIPKPERLRNHRLTWPDLPFLPAPPASVREENYWMMSQRAATMSYHLFAAGFSLVIYVIFHVACDHGQMQIAVFRILGVNALAAYVLHDVVGAAVGSFVPRDAPGWYVSAAFLLFFGITYRLICWLDQRQLFIRL